MHNYLFEEKHKFKIDCSKAKWASDGMHECYHVSGLTNYLNDVDFIIETEKYILLVEYKNANISEAIAHVNKENEYHPDKAENIEKIVKKYYSSFPFLCQSNLLNKKKIVFVFVVEYPSGNSASRKFLRNRIVKMLPFRLQDEIRQNTGIDNDLNLINVFDVLNIEEWNQHDIYGSFPIVPA